MAASGCRPGTSAPGPRQAGVGYDLILLLNNIYYFPRGERAALYRRLGGLLTRPGHLIVATLAAPGSVAAAHLNFMLACQAGAAALPRGGELEADLAEAGFAGIHAQPIVPTEPFLAVRGRPALAARAAAPSCAASFRARQHTRVGRKPPVRLHNSPQVL